MAIDSTPRRSVLYMPGSNERALEKAKSLPADSLILDLEDAVAPNAKTSARDQVSAAVAAGGYGPRELVIRVNALSTPWGYDDLVMAAQSKANAVLLPKVESADAVTTAETIVQAFAGASMPAIWCMMETPRGILNAQAIAEASPHLKALVMGTSDLAKDLHCAHTPSRLPMLYALSHCLMAARGAGLSVIDGVHLDLNDDEGFREQCKQGRELGFDGKTLIHPKTIAAANELFAPDQAAIDWAKRVIEAHEAASARGEGVVLLDDKLIENLHVVDAHRIVALAEAIAAK